VNTLFAKTIVSEVGMQMRVWNTHLQSPRDRDRLRDDGPVVITEKSARLRGEVLMSEPTDRALCLECSFDQRCRHG
jgi:hypothetical protein